MGKVTITGAGPVWDLESADYPANGRGKNIKEKPGILNEDGKFTFSATDAHTRTVVNVVPNGTVGHQFSWSREDFENEDEITIASDDGSADEDLAVTVYYTK